MGRYQVISTRRAFVTVYADDYTMVTSETLFKVFHYKLTLLTAFFVAKFFCMQFLYYPGKIRLWLITVNNDKNTKDNDYNYDQMNYNNNE